MLALMSYNFVLKNDMALKFLPFLNLASIFKCAKFQGWDLICYGDIAVCLVEISYVVQKGLGRIPIEITCLKLSKANKYLNPLTVSPFYVIKRHNCHVHVCTRVQGLRR